MSKEQAESATLMTPELRAEPTESAGPELVRVRAAVSPRRATIMLLLVCVIWGASFPLVKDWQNAAERHGGDKMVASITLIAVRMLGALLILGLARPRLLLAPTWREHVGGMAMGVIFFLGFLLQVRGAADTTPALSAFLTSLGSGWVPLLAYLLWRTRLAPVMLLGLGVGLVGVAVLCVRPEAGWGLGGGEGLTLLSSVLFAVQLLLLDRLGRRVNPAHLTASYFGMAGLLALITGCAWTAAGPGVDATRTWLGAMARDGEVLRSVFLLTLFCTVLAFHWMNTYQPHVTASRAALIYLTEPLFGAAFSVTWGLDQLTYHLFLGGGLILVGNALVDLPVWLRQWKRRADAIP